MNLEPLAQKWKSFGWDVFEIDGHDHNEIFKSCNNDIASKNKPLCVIAKTTKGKGVSFMENNTLWHYRSPQGDELKLAIAELEKKHSIEKNKKIYEEAQKVKEELEKIIFRKTNYSIDQYKIDEEVFVPKLKVIGKITKLQTNDRIEVTTASSSIKGPT